MPASHRDAGDDARPASEETPCRDLPEQLVQLSGRWPALALGEHDIYLANDAIWRIPKRPVPELQHVIDSPAAVAQLVVRGEQLFWLVVQRDGLASAFFTSETIRGEVRSVQPEADARQALERGAAIALSGSGAYVFAAFERAAGSFQVVRVGGDGGRAAAYAEIPARDLFGLAADDDAIYVCTDAGIAAWDGRGLRSAAARGGSNLVADESFLYWREETATGSRLLRASKQTLEPDALTELPGSDSLKLATAQADAYLYWTDESGALSRVPKDGGAAEVIATTGEYDDDDFQPALAIDRTSVYWIGGGAGGRASDDAPIWLYRICK